MTETDFSALAAKFVAACRAHGHEPRVSPDGWFNIQLGVLPKTKPDEGAFILGFDDGPFAALRQDPDYVQRLADATRAHAENTGGRHDG